jgi:hypothetical protein
MIILLTGSLLISISWMRKHINIVANGMNLSKVNIFLRVILHMYLPKLPYEENDEI